jgi:hypothetical protein
MNYEALKIWIDLAQFILMIGLSLIIHRSNKKQVEKDDVIAIEARLTRMETDTKHAPTHSDLSKLYERMAGTEHRLSERIESVGGSVKRLEGESAAQTRILNLVYESLVNK